MYSAWSKLIMLCRLYGWTESRFMIRNHSTAAIPGLTVKDVNFNFSCFVHNRFCFLQVWCPTVFASSGHLCPVNFWFPGHFVLFSAQKTVQQCSQVYFQQLCADLLLPQWGAVDTEIVVPSGENTELKGSPFKAWSRSVYIAIHALLTVRDFFFAYF